MPYVIHHADRLLSGPALAWASSDEFQGDYMTAANSDIVWGATIEAHERSQAARHWTVELESEPLGSLIVDSALPRFAHDAKRLAPNAAPACSLALGRLRMRLKVHATGPNEAAESGQHVFTRALEAALWPRSHFARRAQFTVTVTAAEDYAFAA
jgi:hypothetical protein